jgi:hypothetical protein
VTDLLALPLFDPAHRALATRLAAFAADVIEPRAAAADTGDPVATGRDFIRAAADAGILPLFVAGGSTGHSACADLRAVCLAREAIAAASGLADSVSQCPHMHVKFFGQDLKRHSIMQWPLRLKRPRLVDDSLWGRPSAGIPGAERFERDAKSRRAPRQRHAKPRPNFPQRRRAFGHRSRRCHRSAAN